MMLFTGTSYWVNPFRVALMIAARSSYAISRLAHHLSALWGVLHDQLQNDFGNGAKKIWIATPRGKLGKR
ncbi:MAG: hypothetical protein ACK4N1_05700 [Pseudorhizobium sp.]